MTLLGLHVEAKRWPLVPELQFRKHLREPLHCVFILITVLETAIWVQYLQILKTTLSYLTKGETFRGDSVNEMVKFNYFSTSVLLLRVTGLLI